MSDEKDPKATRSYRVKRGTYTQYVEGKAHVFREGDTIALTDKEAAALGDAVESLTPDVPGRPPFTQEADEF